MIRSIPSSQDQKGNKLTVISMEGKFHLCSYRLRSFFPQVNESQHRFKQPFKCEINFCLSGRWFGLYQNKVYSYWNLVRNLFPLSYALWCSLKLGLSKQHVYLLLINYSCIRSLHWWKIACLNTSPWRVSVKMLVLILNRWQQKSPFTPHSIHLRGCC